LSLSIERAVLISGLRVVCVFHRRLGFPGRQQQSRLEMDECPVVIATNEHAAAIVASGNSQIASPSYSPNEK
jgi:hypothetical protein